MGVRGILCTDSRLLENAVRNCSRNGISSRHRQTFLSLTHRHWDTAISHAGTMWVFGISALTILSHPSPLSLEHRFASSEQRACRLRRVVEHGRATRSAGVPCLRSYPRGEWSDHEWDYGIHQRLDLRQQIEDGQWRNRFRLSKKNLIQTLTSILIFVRKWLTIKCGFVCQFYGNVETKRKGNGKQFYSAIPSIERTL